MFKKETFRFYKTCKLKEKKSQKYIIQIREFSLYCV